LPFFIVHPDIGIDLKDESEIEKFHRRIHSDKKANG
jgi:hypothetical protein